MSPESRFSALLRAGALTAGLLLATGLPAQTPAEPQRGDDSFGEVVEVRRVNVEVYATDSDGNRVTDLTEKDFQVFEDGRQVEITNFLAVAGGKPIEAPSVLDAPAIETAPVKPAQPAVPEEEIPEERKLWVVLYVDNLHLRPFNRNKVLGHVRTFLRGLPQGTEVMLISYDRSVHVRETFTTDRDLVAESTFELESLSSFVVEKQTSRDNTLKEIKGITKDAIRAENEAETYAKGAFDDVEQSVKAVDETIELLGGIPGRKALVYISDGLEMRAGEDMFQLVVSQYSTTRERSGIALQSNRYNARRLFTQLVSRANSSGITFYTIDAAGLKAGGTAADRGGGGSTLEVDITYQLNLQEPLLLMADETGGLASIGTSNFGRAFENIKQDFTFYYSLAYQPNHGGDGRQHDIQVKVTRKGVKLRYRDDYRDKSNEARVSETVTAALLYGTGNNPLGIDAKALDLVEGSQGERLLPVEVRIPIGKITLVPRGELQSGRVRVAIALLDEDGGKSPVDQREVPIDIPAKDIDVALTKYFVYAAQLRIGKGSQRMVVTVRDEFAGTESTVRKALVFGN